MAGPNAELVLRQEERFEKGNAANMIIMGVREENIGVESFTRCHHLVT